MQLQEFQAKKLLSHYSIATPSGILAVTSDDAEAAATRLGSGTIFVKAQIRAGDRSAAGGIRAVQSPADARDAAKTLLGRKLVTSQTGPHGHTVREVLVECGVQAVREFYLALSVDTVTAAITITAGEGGGVGIEQRLAVKSVGLETLQLGIKGERRAGDIAEFCRRIGLPEPRKVVMM